MADVTGLLQAAERGDPKAADRILLVVYDELRKLAAARLAAESPGQTLQPTALVHEAYLRLVGGTQPQDWSGRGHFFAAAAEAMRRILVERARRKGAAKNGGGRARVDLDEVVVLGEDSRPELLDLDEVLDRLAAAEPRAADLVKLRFFAGLTGEQAAAALDMSPRAADLLWAYARAWLFERLNREG